ncbi:MAG: cyanophycin synthetase, partial [Bacillota bacterium]|nr:cyanophycin synthetase [Bacillota bacterium]
MGPKSFKVFDGRNIYSHRKCIRLILDLEDCIKIDSDRLTGFNERLLKLLPELKSHRCSPGEVGGFAKVLEQGTPLNHVCGHIAVALQNRVGADVSFCSESKSGSSICYTVYEFKYRNTGIEAGNIAVEIINSLVEGREVGLSSKL